MTLTILIREPYLFSKATHKDWYEIVELAYPLYQASQGKKTITALALNQRHNDLKKETPLDFMPAYSE